MDSTNTAIPAVGTNLTHNGINYVVECVEPSGPNTLRASRGNVIGMAGLRRPKGHRVHLANIRRDGSVDLLGMSL